MTMPPTLLKVPDPDLGLDALAGRCLRHARQNKIPLPGLDPAMATRCRALLYAHTALAAIATAESEKQIVLLERLSTGYLRAHDDLADLSWYSWPSTVREERRETRRMLDAAMGRRFFAQQIDRLVAAIEGRGRRRKAA